MLNKKMFLLGVLATLAMPAYADDTEFIDVIETDVVDDAVAAAENASAMAVAAYDVDGTLFQQITDLEQQKVIMQLEKERAQLDLELDRLAAEKLKLNMEIETLTGRAEQQQQEIENEKAKLAAEAEKLAREREALKNAPAPTVAPTTAPATTEKISSPLGDKYRVVNIVGAGTQLQATITDLDTGQSRRITAGKTLDGYRVTQISLDDGVVLTNDDGDVQTLNVSSGN